MVLQLRALVADGLEVVWAEQVRLGVSFSSPAGLFGAAVRPCLTASISVSAAE